MSIQCNHMEKHYSAEKYSLKVMIFVGQVIAALVLYLFSIFLYTNISAEPIIFFASGYLALLLAAVTGGLIFIFFRKAFDRFTIVLMSLCCALIIILFAIFGPVFIDRSISYHIVFYATEHGNIKADQLENTFSRATFDKRIKEAQAAGFIVPDDNGRFIPTPKAKLFSAIMKSLGKLSHTLENYQAMTTAHSNEDITP